MNDNSINEIISNGNELINAIRSILENFYDSPMISIGEILTICVAGIAALISLSSILISNKASKNIAEIVQNGENDRTKALINANLTANARIEWIQNVRKASTALITSLNLYIVASNEKEARSVLQQIYENKTLLILYFGPDKEVNNKSELNNTKSNTGKNNLIVKMLNSLYINIQNYHSNVEAFKHFSNEIRDCEKSFLIDDEGVENFYPKCDSDEYGTLVTKEQCKSCLEEKKLYPSIKRKQVEETKRSIDEIVEIMRIYLKIEWENVKENKE